MTRTSMLTALSSAYVKTARTKGIKTHTIIFVHALRNALAPIGTGLIIAGVITIFRVSGGGWLAGLIAATSAGADVTVSKISRAGLIGRRSGHHLDDASLVDNLERDCSLPLQGLGCDGLSCNLLKNGE